ncbi:hypothetical protein CONPUDRAFT_126817 [Coniophora puteana RWD-64-598 SS2]|uniref:DNA polymerase n=1 Tax=Coniophora puteana (strain RWD-64-598) TaxID=741705 RepID=A0A5M3MJ73_CONPW|nr:uncharacterized protein CONPUDRAFT_126817 [Coniophora puteana RWD-64-598 SS2]EIW79037.1 hypothetical protein CONPUDRAFT_126817 [Coniophora puteana RWD-64-598 SS2]
MADRSRRPKNAADKLAEYKRIREGGSRKWKSEEDDTIYDEVNEDQYKKIVKGRLQKDDFVVDDGVDGYMDNGMDDWAGGEEDEEEDEQEQYARKKAKKEQVKPRAKPKAPPEMQSASINAYRPAVPAEQEDDFMNNLLGDLESAPIRSRPAPKKTRKRKPSPPPEDDPDRSSPAPYRNRDFEPDLNDVMSPKKKARYADGSASIVPEMRKMGKLDVHSDADDIMDVDMEAFMDVADDDLEDIKPVVKKEPVAVKLPPAANGHAKVKKEEKDTGPPSWLSVYDSLTVTSDDVLGSTSAAATSSSSKNTINALAEDGTLPFFWLDFLELSGKLFLTGKVKDRTTGAWASACLSIEGLQRNLYVLPRQLRVEQVEDEDGEVSLQETEHPPSRADVYGDFDRIRQRLDIKSFKAKWVRRSYAFDEKDVPKEAEWLKVLYPFEDPHQVPMDAQSPNIARIFGTNTSAFELFVLKRKIMGPCWLNVRNAVVENKGISWCKLEASVSDPKDVTPMGDGAPEPPPLTIMSMTVRTVVNHKENKREIVCVTSRIWRDVVLDDPTPPEQLPCSVHTFVRPLERFPPKFEAQAKANKRGLISPMLNERTLLNNLLVTLYKSDPDVIVGHDFLGVSLDVLLTRMRDLKADHWSRLSRFRRNKWPNIGRQGTNMRFLNGRMLCDLASDGARSMIASTTWSLTEMCKTHLKSDRQDIDPDDTASYFDSAVSAPDMLMTFVRHCELDAHYQMAIASKVQILPLTRQLTNLAGNAWNKTLNGGRAERNEYILLHEFHRLKYICPDKTYGKKVKPEPEPDEADEEGGNAAGGGGGGKASKAKRDKYKGGLVFEPKRGLWDKFILVMDFNSLYPSIIQEYNIDFTTVERQVDDPDDKIPEPPSSDVAQGVLPRLIATLVSRRRQVKSLMKDKSATPAKLLQYDIKQQALKLTANSMYGCLGFEYSRFYARPLAALTTFKGREILTHTRELAESLQLDVVYGDTDSVFVNSNVTELSEALKISNEFKKAVNDRYRLLEIDLDGVFARLLLLQKKKYAAIKVEDGSRTSTEIKGLDMKRREYCALSKNVSQYVLDQILSGEATEIVVEQIHEYLTSVSENVRSGKIKVDDFIIFKRLGKNPEDYPDAKSLPHVHVALRLKAKGGSARAGDVIPYIFCVAPGEDSSKTAQAERAKHPDELRRADTKELQIDYDHYLANQILPPIERLCEPIEGTDRARLAECLGLDPSRFRSSSAGEATTSFATLDSQITDAERFRDANPFLVRCRGCQGQLAFSPLWEDDACVRPTGVACPACSAPLSTVSLQTQLEVQIRACIARYYEGWTVCDDTTCGNRTRSMRVYGRRCVQPECRGSVHFEYSDTELYNQLRYFATLFDEGKIKAAAAGSARKDAIDGLLANPISREFLETMAATVGKYVEQCGRRYVDMAALFGSLRV